MKMLTRCLASLLFATTLVAQQGVETAIINSAYGTITITRQSESLRGYQGTRLYQGDTIKTGKNAAAKLYFFNGSSLHLESDASITLGEGDRKTEVAIQLDHGNIWSHVRKRTQMTIENDQGTAVVDGSSGHTNFNINGNDDTLSVYVSKGAVSIKKDDVVTEVSRGKEADVTQTGVTVAKPTSKPKPSTMSKLPILTTSILGLPRHNEPFPIQLMIRRGRSLAKDASFTLTLSADNLQLSTSRYGTWSNTLTVTVKEGSLQVYAKGSAESETAYTIQTQSDDTIALQPINVRVLPSTETKTITHDICEKQTDTCYSIELEYERK